MSQPVHAFLHVYGKTAGALAMTLGTVFGRDRGATPVVNFSAITFHMRTGTGPSPPVYALYAAYREDVNVISTSITSPE
ncbi:hypothetical protein DPMN_088141 [Dreissena polymorpha]|uniref:Uncharacterized protein n=1 Tax=Dreissena polymorpha TaxID=45954 RepID=A0A9D4QW52_DREPO|nr:hypothetical protein DPMN_088141 [Dreissena polymorpha]